VASSVDYLGSVDRDAHVRAARRRQAQDALEFERDREEMLTIELDDAVAGIEGKRVDSAVFAQMSSEDVRLVREAIGDDSIFAASIDRDDIDRSTESDADGFVREQEIARLRDELASSRRLQAALERYLEVLSARTTAA
jgi:hypothetical protein